MPTTQRALIDLNVILDVLQRREPFFQDSAGVLAAAELGNIEGLVAAHSLTTLFYLMSKGESAERARVSLTDLMQFLQVAAVNQEVLEQALNLPYSDFEDAVQMMAAVRAGARVLVTRNVHDFRHGPLPVLQPVELLALLNE
jgi:predicted nucleic acid-binding protein